VTPGAVFHWWLKQRRDCLPEVLRRPWRRTRAELTLQITADRVAVGGPLEHIALQAGVRTPDTPTGAEADHG